MKALYAALIALLITGCSITSSIYHEGDAIPEEVLEGLTCPQQDDAS